MCNCNAGYYTSKFGDRYCMACDKWKGEIKYERYDNSTSKNPYVEIRIGYGSSSKTIWHVMTGIPNNEARERADIPWDPSDFGRCHRLLELVPEWRAQMYKMGDRYVRWVPLVDNWDKMTEIYLRDLPTGKSEELHKLMKQLRGEK